MTRTPPCRDGLEALVAAAATDPAALAELLQRTEALRRRLVRLAQQGRARDPMMSVDDVAQEVALQVIRSIRSYDPTRGRFPTWLAGITRHVVSRRRHMNAVAIDERRHLAPPQLSRVALRQTLSTPTLSPDERTILSMVAVGFTSRDVAEALGINQAAASKRIARIRTRLEPNMTLSG